MQAARSEPWAALPCESFSSLMASPAGLNSLLAGPISFLLNVSHSGPFTSKAQGSPQQPPLGQKTSPRACFPSDSAN